MSDEEPKFYYENCGVCGDLVTAATRQDLGERMADHRADHRGR